MDENSKTSYYVSIKMAKVVEGELESIILKLKSLYIQIWKIHYAPRILNDS